MPSFRVTRAVRHTPQQMYDLVADVEQYPHVILLDSTGRVLWSGNPLDRAKLEAAVKQSLKK